LTAPCKFLHACSSPTGLWATMCQPRAGPEGLSADEGHPVSDSVADRVTLMWCSPGSVRQCAAVLVALLYALGCFELFFGVWVSLTHTTGLCFVLCDAGVTTPSRDKVYPCPYTPAPARGCWGGGGTKRLHIICASVEVFAPGLLTSCHASSWVSAAAGDFVGCSGPVLQWIYKLAGHVHCIGWRPLGIAQPCF